jgi:hypothetical protein
MDKKLKAQLFPIIKEAYQEIIAENKVEASDKEIRKVIRAMIKEVFEKSLNEGKKVDSSKQIKLTPNKVNPWKKKGFMEGDPKILSSAKPVKKKESQAKHMIKKAVNSKAKFGGEPVTKSNAKFFMKKSKKG